MQAVLPFSTIQHQEISQKNKKKFYYLQELVKEAITAHQAFENLSNNLAEATNDALEALLFEGNDQSMLFSVLFQTTDEFLKNDYSFRLAKETLGWRIFLARAQLPHADLIFGKAESVNKIEEAAKQTQELSNRYRERPKEKRINVWIGVTVVAFTAFVPLGLTVITTVAVAALGGLAIALWNTLQAPKPFVVTAEEVQKCLIPLFGNPEEGKVLDLVYPKCELIVKELPGL